MITLSPPTPKTFINAIWKYSPIECTIRKIKRAVLVNQNMVPCTSPRVIGRTFILDLRAKLGEAVKTASRVTFRVGILVYRATKPCFILLLLLFLNGT